MLPRRLEILFEENRALRAELRAQMHVRHAIIRDYRDYIRCCGERRLLLRMTEHLIEAHKVAKIDGNGYTLDLIEEALTHAGKRLHKEV